MQTERCFKNDIRKEVTYPKSFILFRLTNEAYIKYNNNIHDKKDIFPGHEIIRIQS